MVYHKTATVDGHSVSYREADSPGKPQIVLLHRFLASSHQYHNLISALADRFHVIAPDYLGFGNSEMPDPAKFPYTFEKLSEIVENLLEQKGFDHFGLYAQDYRGPVGFRIVTRRQRWLDWLILQNTNAYEVGFTSAWDGFRAELYGRVGQLKSRSPRSRKLMRSRASIFTATSSPS